jgi:hypothetical protein
MIVPVLITSCHVSEWLRKVTCHRPKDRHGHSRQSAPGEATASATPCEKFRNALFIGLFSRVRSEADHVQASSGLGSP